MSFINRRAGGLVLGAPLNYQVDVRPLIKGDEVSWMDGLVVGDDQGQEGACAFFALQNWEQRVLGVVRSDEEIKEVYKSYLRRTGQSSGGATFMGAFEEAHMAGWLKGKNGVILTRKIESLKDQPLLVGRKIYESWNHVGRDGRIDSCAGLSIGSHATLMVAIGRVQEDEFRISEENSWGLGFGYEGMYSLSQYVHQTSIKEMWVVV